MAPQTPPSLLLPVSFCKAVAENKLCWDLLKPKIEAGFVDLPRWTASYGPMQGQPMLTEPLARFLSAELMGGKVVVPAGELVCGTGVSSILSSLFFSICEESDTVLIPSPYYSAFDNDLRAFGNVKRHAVALNAANGFVLTPALLEEAYASVLAATGKAPKALLLTNPHNPLGRIAPPAELEAVVAWCGAKPGLHLVADEIYALSVHGPYHRAAAATAVTTALATVGAEAFTSVGVVCKGALGPRIHVLWGMSKDWGVSGLRFGLCWTSNPKLYEAMSSAAIFTCLPGPVQAMLGAMFSDAAWCSMYVAENARRLAGSYDLLTGRLDALGLPYLPAPAGMFLWMDFRRLLPFVALPDGDGASGTSGASGKSGKSGASDDEDGWRREAAVYDGLVAAGVVLTPGSSQHHGEPGWFRTCFAFVGPTGLAAALDRIEAFAAKLGYKGP